MAGRVEDEAAFLMQVAERLRGTTVRTLVAQQAYDRLADQLTILAIGGGFAADSACDPRLLMSDPAQATQEPTR
jgi:hypothetical protein